VKRFLPQVTSALPVPMRDVASSNMLPVLFEDGHF
jgi:hypothetical protein